MQPLQNEDQVEAHRHALMRFLNEYHLEAPAILSMVRQAEPCVYEPGEAIIQQDFSNQHIFFLVEGAIRIEINNDGKVTQLGERNDMVLIGEISYFNRTPATATVLITKDQPAVVLRLSYEIFDEIIENYKDVKPTLARIGEMRMISQRDGFCSFKFFMDMIGWKRDRLAVNRAAFYHLEDLVKNVLFKLVGKDEKILDAGDGPGIISEIIHDLEEERTNNLFLQVTHLEEAILNPMQAYTSDFSRTKFLGEKFKALLALQVFQLVDQEQVSVQFERAARLVDPGGYLLVIQLRVVEIKPKKSRTDIRILFEEMENLVGRIWPGILEGGPLVRVTFVDADFDPMMEWNPHFMKVCKEGTLEMPGDLTEGERSILDVLVDQVGKAVFHPDEFYYNWLGLQGVKHGFILKQADQVLDDGFYYQLFERK